MTPQIEAFAALLLIAALVAMLAHRLRLPYATGLLVAGYALAQLPQVPHLAMTRELVFDTLLPPLIFEAALFLPWRALRREFVPAAVLASLGLLVAAAIVTAGMMALAGWPALPAALFGALIAATDPVSVIATLRSLGVKGRLRVLVEAESLFNDGTAAVLFALVLAAAEGVAPTPLGALAALARMVAASLLAGAAVALGLRLLAKGTRDPLVAVVLTLVAAYASFLLAEHYGGSGVLATLTTGVAAARSGPAAPVRAGADEVVRTFWEAVAFIANSLVFLLIGTHEAQRDFGALGSDLAWAIALVTFGRAAAVYPTAALLRPTRWRVPLAHQHVLVWGGLRGALALALALGLPPQLPGRDAIITTAFAVVTFSLLVQAPSMSWLLRRLRLDEAAAEAHGAAPEHGDVTGM